MQCNESAKMVYRKQNLIKVGNCYQKGSSNIREAEEASLFLFTDPKDIDIRLYTVGTPFPQEICTNTTTSFVTRAICTG